MINDIDGDLINFFRVIKSSPEAFLESFDLELVSRAEYERLAALDPSQLDDITRAHRFYYLIMAGWGGELNYPRFQTSITDGGHGNRLVGALKALRQRIEPVHERLSTVLIENLDWRECIERYDREGVVMYIDPPYPGNGANYAHNMRKWEDHYELAEYLKNSKSKWILSSYDNRETRDMFDEYTIIPVALASGMRIKKNDTTRVIVNELLITNFDPEADVSSERLQHRQNELL